MVNYFEINTGQNLVMYRSLKILDLDSPLEDYTKTGHPNGLDLHLAIITIKLGL